MSRGCSIVFWICPMVHCCGGIFLLRIGYHGFPVDKGFDGVSNSSAYRTYDGYTGESV